MTQFEGLGLSPAILKSIHALGFDNPTPIQREAIPLLLEGHDLMGLAQTGTGKTAAFGLPLAQHLLKLNTQPAPKTVHALILAPTRELANQIAGNIRDFVRRTPLRVGVVVGGASINMQRQKLARGTDILVATPGRLLDLANSKSVLLDKVQFLVLDEADQMLDLGFIHDLRKISRLLGQNRQTMMFSATMPKLVEELSQTYLNDPVRVEVTPPGRSADKVRQSVHFVSRRGKTELLKDCLIERRNDLSLVFMRTKHSAERLKVHLVECGFEASSIHGNKSQSQRDRAIREFKEGKVRILVATDVAARGIDIPNVSHVYNYDLPEVPENYVHRIGRTARAGAEGEAVAFCAPDEQRLLRAVEKLMGIEVTVASGEPSEQSQAEPGANNRRRPRRGNKSRPRRKPKSGQKARPKAGPSAEKSKERKTKPSKPAGRGKKKPTRNQNRKRHRPGKTPAA